MAQVFGTFRRADRRHGRQAPPVSVCRVLGLAAEEVAQRPRGFTRFLGDRLRSRPGRAGPTLGSGPSDRRLGRRWRVQRDGCGLTYGINRDRAKRWIDAQTVRVAPVAGCGPPQRLVPRMPGRPPFGRRDRTEEGYRRPRVSGRRCAMPVSPEITRQANAVKAARSASEVRPARRAPPAAAARCATRDARSRSVMDPVIWTAWPPAASRCPTAAKLAAGQRRADAAAPGCSSVNAGATGCGGAEQQVTGAGGNA